MRHLSRLPEPEIITRKKEEWLEKFLASDSPRPDSSKYGNPRIREQLNSMSHHKCFYCETKLKGQRKEVDHHIEVVVDPSLSFDWDNLCLACDSCNNKIRHDAIPIDQALNPCVDSDGEIDQHLTFDDELVAPQHGSVKGLSTIQKYRLDSDVLDTRRLQSLKRFYKVVIQVHKNQIKEGRDCILAEELALINRFKSPDSSFSLMYRVKIDEHDFEANVCP